MTARSRTPDEQVREQIDADLAWATEQLKRAGRSTPGLWERLGKRLPVSEVIDGHAAGEEQ
jgi:hypothetical protein